jgi:hypothetical protein
MDKYQKAAALDLIKVALIAVAASVTFSIIASYLTASQIIMSLAFVLLVYCGYNLFKIRVDQLRTLDELNRDRK